jgi:signal transduction histidine kinase
MKSIYLLVFFFFFLFVSSGIIRGQSTNADKTVHGNNWYHNSGTLSDSARLNSGFHLIRIYFQEHSDSMYRIMAEIEREGRHPSKAGWRGKMNYLLGQLYDRNGQLDSSLYYYRYSMSHTAPDNYPMIAAIYASVGGIYIALAQTDSARYYLSQSTELIEKYSIPIDVYNKGNAFINLARIYDHNAEQVKAIDYYQKALLYSTPEKQVEAHVGLCIIFNNLGLMELAQENMQLAKKIIEQQGVDNKQTLMTSYFAQIMLSSTIEEAQQYMRDGVALDSSDRYNEMYLYYATATKAIALEQYTLAASYVTKGLALARSIQEYQSELDFLLTLAEVQQKAHQHAASHKICQSLKSIFTKSENWEYLMVLCEIESFNMEALGYADSALYYLRERDRLVKKIGNKETTIKNTISAYMSNKAEQERQYLNLEKLNAENLAALSDKKTQISYLVLLFVTFLLSSIAIVWYTRFRQKTRYSQMLEDERNKLESANTQLRRFSGIITHDILSNLDYVLASGNRLNTYDPPIEALKEYFSTSRDTCKQLKNYCVGLLNEVQQQPQTVVTNVTHPMAAIQNTIARFDAALREAGFTVNVDRLSPSLLPPMLVEHLFQNLISNALRYAATAPVPLLRITEEGSAPGPYHWVVEDNGPGISAEKKHTIFEPKQDTNDSVGQHVGLGLLRANLRTHGADLWAEDRDGGGTRWVIRLPAPPKNTL